MLNEMDGSQIGEEKEAYALVNSCRPYGGQPIQVSWRRREVLRLAESSTPPISIQLYELA